MVDCVEHLDLIESVHTGPANPGLHRPRRRLLALGGSSVRPKPHRSAHGCSRGTGPRDRRRASCGRWRDGYEGRSPASPTGARTALENLAIRHQAALHAEVASAWIDGPPSPRSAARLVNGGGTAASARRPPSRPSRRSRRSGSTPDAVPVLPSCPAPAAATPAGRAQAARAPTALGATSLPARLALTANPHPSSRGCDSTHSKERRSTDSATRSSRSHAEDRRPRLLRTPRRRAV